MPGSEVTTRLPLKDVVMAELAAHIADWRPTPDEETPGIEYWMVCALLHLLEEGESRHPEPTRR